MNDHARATWFELLVIRMEQEHETRLAAELWMRRKFPALHAELLGPLETDPLTAATPQRSE